MSVCRTGTFYHRKMIFVYKADNLRLLQVEQRTNHGKFDPIQIGDGGKGVQPAFIDELHEECFHGIVLVVRICDRVAV